MHTDNPTERLTVEWLEQYPPLCEVWHLDTGGYYAGDVDEDTEAAWVGTVADLLHEMGE
jgi:hypothetical protein